MKRPEIVNATPAQIEAAYFGLAHAEGGS